MSVLLARNIPMAHMSPRSPNPGIRAHAGTCRSQLLVRFDASKKDAAASVAGPHACVHACTERERERERERLRDRQTVR